MKKKITRKLALTVLLASTVLAVSAVNDTIVKTGHVWKYLDNGSNQGTSWRATSFNDASWASGPSQLGYGDGDEATVVSYGSNSNNKYITTYFRKSISVSNLANYTSLTMKIKRDDGIVVYINGTERYRSNMPSGTISYNTYASGNASNDGNNWLTVSLPLSALVSGNNVIAAEIHQRTANSSDITFDLMLYGNYSCGTPTGLSTTSITSNSATVNWAAGSGATNYSLQYKTAASSTWTTISTGNVTSYTLTGLLSNTAYNWRVSRTCVIGTSSTTSTQNFTTLTTPCNTPTGLTSSSITTSGATISWAAVSGATSYDVWYRVVGNPTWSSQINAVSTSLNLTGLNYSTNYEWQVHTNCSGGSQSAWSSSATFTTLTPVCNTPSGLSSSAVTTSSATVAWSAVTGASNYTVQYRIIGAPGWTTLSNTSSTSVGLTGLAYSSNYEWQVRTNCIYGNQSAWSSSATFTTLTPVCNTPSGLSSSAVTTSSATVAWSAVTGASNYTVQYRIIGAPSWTTATNTSSTSLGLTGLAYSSNYEWQVRTNCIYGNQSSWSSSTTFTTQTPVCNIPGGLMTTGITTSSATVSWSAVTGASSYDVQYREVGAGIWNTLNTASTTVALSGLDFNSQYEWQVRTNCIYGNQSAFSSSVFFTTNNIPCNDASNLVVSNITTTSADLSWDAVSGSVSYNINFREVGAGSWNSTSSLTNTVTLSGLNPAANYEWQVEAICQFNNSNFVNGSNFTTATPVCNDVTNLSVTNITYTTADLNWNLVSGAISYNVIYRQVGMGIFTTVSTSGNSISVSGLNPSTDYEWLVQSVCQYSSGNFASGNNFTTNIPSCGDPANLTAGNITTTTANLSWDAVSGALSYNINYRVIGAGTWNSTTSVTNSTSLSGLNPVADYEWQAQAICQYATSGFVNGNNFTTATPPCNDATNLNVSNIIVSSADLNWDAVSGALSYNINYREVGAGAWNNTSSLTNGVSISGLNPAQDYEWQVQAVCQYLNSNFVNGNNFTTATPPCNDATNLNVSNITVSSADLNWDAVSGALSYNINYREVGAGAWNNTSSLTNSVSLSGLNPAQDYEWQVQVICQYLNSNVVNGNNFTTATPPCYDATNLNVSNITVSSADLNWDAVIGALSYNINYRIVGAGSWNSTTSLTNTVSIAGLNPSENYEWQVQTLCQYSSSNFVNGNNFTSATPPCNDATNLIVSNITVSSADLNWDAVIGALSYNINYRIVGAGIWNSTSSLTNSASLSGLNSTSDYEWQVQAICQYAGSNFVNGNNFTTATPPCSDATNLSVSNITVSSADLNWDAVSGALSYNIDYRIVGAGAWNNTSSLTNSISLSGLNPVSDYEWRVQSVCSAGNGTFVNGNNFTTATPPCNDAANLIVSNIGTNNADLSWDVVSGATGYNVQYRVTGATTWSTANSVVNSLSLTGLTYSFYIMNGKVQAVCQYSNSNFTSGNNFITLTPACDVPSGQASSAITTSSATVSWSAVTGASSYDVQYREVGAGSWNAAINTASTSLSLSSLSYSTNYEWQVRTNCIYGNQSAYSASATFTTLTPSCDVPSGQASSAITTSSATVSWNAVTGASSYDVQYREVGAGSWNAAINTASTSIALSGLNYNSNYEWQVRTNCIYGNQSAFSASATFTTSTPACDVPSGQASSAITTSSATVSWSAVTGASSYDLQYRVVGAGSWNAAINTASTSIALSGLNYNSNYEWQVRTNCIYGNQSAYSASATFTTSTPACDVPSGQSSSAITTSSATVSWSAVTGASSYDVQYRVVGAGSWNAAINTASTSLSLSSLSYSTNYEWQVRTNCIYGNQSAYSASATFTTITPACDVPSGQASSAITTSSATVSWSTVTGASSYDVQYRVVGAGSWNAAINTASTSLSLSSLSYSTNYEWQVRTNCIYGNQSAYSSSATFTTSTPACNVPTGQASSAITTSSATVSWSAVTGASSYDVQYRVVGAGSWNAAINTASTSLSLSSLSYSTNYEWQVRTNCIYGNQSAFSASAPFLTLTPTCAVPTGQASSAITTSSATVSWSAVTGASSYDVQYRVVGAGSWNAAINTASTSLSLSSLSYSTNYEWQVRTNCIYGNQSTYSTSATFTTSTPACNVPSGQSSSAITTSSATVSWSAVTGASTYTVQYRIVGAPSWTTASNTASTSLGLSGLSYSSNYEWQVRTNCIYGNQSAFSASSNFTTSTPACNVPTGQASSAITASSATVSWSAVTGASSYDVQYRVVGAGSWNAAVNTASTSLSLSSLSYSTNYEWQVRTNCIYGNQSAYSSSSTFTTLVQPCDVPSGILSGTVTATSAKILWETVTNAVSYNVRYRVNGGSTWTTLNSVVNNITITGLSGSTKYECQVSTVCSGNSSAYSSSVVFTTSASQYADSLLFAYGNWKYFDSGTNPGTDWKLLSFNDASWLSGNAELGYGDSDESTVVSYGPDANNKYTTTYFRKKINVTNASSYVSLSLKAVRDDGIIVYLNGTELYRTNMPTGTVTNSTFATAAISGTDESAWQTATVSTAGLVNGDNMIAVEIHQSDLTSSDISFNLNLGGNTPPPACNTPAGLSSTSITTSSANVSWNSVAGASSYDVQYRVVGAGSWNTAINTASTSLALTGLNYSSNYEWQVRTNCIYGNQSAYSSSATFTTLTPTCNVPSGLASSGISSTTATVSWGAVTGASTYDVQYRIVGAGSWNAAINTASTSLGLSGLTANTNYEWQVRTNCTYGNQSAYSTSATFTTTSAAVCNTPAGLTIGTLTTTSAVVSWSTVSGAINYTVQFRTIGAGSWSSVSTASLTTTLTGLTTARTYEVQVSTNCSGGSSAFSSSVSFTTPLAASIIARSAYLQVVTPTSFRVRWRTTVATNSQVRYGTTMGYGGVASNATSTTEHEVLVSGLTANTKYYYALGSSTQDLQGDLNFYCYTSIATGATTPFRVWATGDFGTNSSGQTTTRDAMNTYCTGNLPRIWLWMGDNAYNSGTDAEFTSNVFNIYPNQMKNIPIYPCLGNHDYANVGYKSASALTTNFPYFSMFTCPTAAEAGGVASATEKYYSYNYGNVHFIVIDSYGSLNASGTAQYTWLQNDLAANTQRFTIAIFHHAPYSHGTHNSDTEAELVDMRNNFTPLFDQYKVDLVLNGHSHTYERTWLIKGHQGIASTFTNAMKVDTTNGLSPYYLKSTANNFDGTVYCVCGVSGQGGSVSTSGTWPHNAMRQYSKALFGSMIIDFSGDTLDAKFVTSAGAVYDRFKIVKSGVARIGNSTLITGTKGNEVEAFPNPFSNELNVRFMLEKESPVLIEIYDLLGKKIYTSESKIKGRQDAGTYELTISPDELNDAHGMVIIKVNANGKTMQTMVDKLD